MKNRFYSLPIKATAIVLAALIGLLTVLSAAAGVVMEAEGFYTRSEDTVLKDVYREILDNRNYQTFSYVIDMEAPHLATEFSENYYYQILDESGTVVAGNYTDKPVQLSHETANYWELYVPGNDYYVERQYTVVGYLAAELSGIDIFTTARDWVGFFYPLRYWVFGLAFIGLLAEVALIIYLFCSAGNHPGEEKPRLNPVDKIPFDVATAVLILLASVQWMMLIELEEWEVVIFLLLFGIVDFLLVLWYFLSLATRLKLGALFHGTLLGKLLLLLGKGFKRLGGWLRYLFSNLPLVWKTGLAVAALSFAELVVLLAVWDKGALLGWWFLEKLLLAPPVVLLAICLRRLQKGGHRLAEGGLDERVDTRYLIGDFKDFGETLNSIGSGMNKAVEERMKSERFKTELITNVSHDIKTPLTSIINYVDLIKKEEPENENIRQYVEVLDRQSARLKKLIEDLVEASKASTGNLPVHPAPCDAGVLLTQMVGEYDERFREKGLEPILHQPDIPIMVMADPRHFWRILDNLMVNIVKYAQRGTRVYLDLFAGEREAAILFRNISQAPLNISGEELMERFVRGDSSRNTEGSGLGLSIARSLAELQGGRLQIEVDGDLFKVTLRFTRL